MSRNRHLLRTLALVGALALMHVGFLTAPAMAAAETNTSSGFTTKGPGLAAHGYDVVAYFTAGEPTIGSARYSTAYENATYRFASKENLSAFKKAPERYVPSYGGYCAYGVSVGAKFDGDPRLWRIVDGRLFFNLNEEIRDKWVKNIPRNVEKADRNWSKIGGKTPAELK